MDGPAAGGALMSRAADRSALVRGDGGLDWPNAVWSREVLARELRWHVQQTAIGPGILLLHGTGSATHSWRDLLPLLSAHGPVLAPDLPGHGFSERPRRGRASLPHMAAALQALLAETGHRPRLVVGHSAGAAIMVRMALDGALPGAALVAINPAWLPFSGLPGLFFSPLAKLLSVNPLVPVLVSRSARDPAAVPRLLESTGSTLDSRGLACYETLLRRTDHVAGTLQMMSEWNLNELSRDLPGLNAPLLVITGERDAAISAAERARVRRLLPQATHSALTDGGHLLHEEHPQAVVDQLLAWARAQGVALR